MIDISTGWRQVRIFTQDFTPNWYFGLLRTFCIPFAQKYPDTYFWFSRYGDQRGRQGEDTDDTDISQIPLTHLNPQKFHLSIRLRFRPISDEEDFLTGLTGSFWWSDIRDFDAIWHFGPKYGRFYSGAGDGITRASLVSHTLCSNSRLVLDSLTPAGFEINHFDYNALYQSHFLSMLHMFANVYGRSDGSKFRIRAGDDFELI